MKYIVETDISAGWEKVVSIFDSVESLFRWQASLRKIDLVNGMRGREGSTLRLVYRAGLFRLVVLESVKQRSSINDFIVVYQTRRLCCQARHRFIAIEPEKTRWSMECEIKCNGILRILAVLWPQYFYQKTYKYMRAFQAYIETDRT